MINQPNFYEGKIFYQTLYEINKSMIENVKEYSLSIADFKEYVEMWIHEVKIPISSLVLLNHNHQNSLDSKYVKQIRKLDNYIDQILYFVRSENVEKDYIIKEKKLQEIIKNVNYYAKIAKERTLTEEELSERDKYRKLYLEKFKAQVRGNLDSIKIVDFRRLALLQASDCRQSS